jgi:hypothetical protein
LPEELLEFCSGAQTSCPWLDGSVVVQVDGTWKVPGTGGLRALLPSIELSL